MPEDVFAEVAALEAEAERLVAEARQRAEALRAEAQGRIQHLEREAQETFDSKTSEHKSRDQARLADEQRRETKGFDTLVARLETVRTTRIQALADWLIERLMDSDREH